MSRLPGLRTPAPCSQHCLVPLPRRCAHVLSLFQPSPLMSLYSLIICSTPLSPSPPTSHFPHVSISWTLTSHLSASLCLELLTPYLLFVLDLRSCPSLGRSLSISPPSFLVFSTSWTFGLALFLVALGLSSVCLSSLLVYRFSPSLYPVLCTPLSVYPSLPVSCYPSVASCISCCLYLIFFSRSSSCTCTSSPHFLLLPSSQCTVYAFLVQSPLIYYLRRAQYLFLHSFLAVSTRPFYLYPSPLSISALPLILFKPL